jgi:hypothetical protein
MNQSKLVKYVTIGVAIFAAYKFAQKIFPDLHKLIDGAVKTGQVPPPVSGNAGAYQGVTTDELLNKVFNKSGAQGDIIDVTPIRSTTR